jgi:hypothetical protein
MLAATVVVTGGAAARAQNLTLEGQTGGFITPTAYVVESEKGHIFSHPAIGYHFVNADQVIGDIHNFSITEGFANRAEVGYTRNVHWTGDNPLISRVWHSAGMNIFHGKVVVIPDGHGSRFMPGLAAGFVVRTHDKYVTGALEGIEAGMPNKANSYTNEDVYAVLTKTWRHAPLPFLANFGWKATNASIFGIGGQSTRFGGLLFGGLGFPIPLPHDLVIVPAAGFSMQPPNVKNLNFLLYPPGIGSHIPTTLDYAVRLTQREHPHFAFDAGVGQVAGKIGQTAVGTNRPPPFPPFVLLPIDLKARAVFGLGLSYKF